MSRTKQLRPNNMLISADDLSWSLGLRRQAMQDGHLCSDDRPHGPEHRPCGPKTEKLGKFDDMLIIFVRTTALRSRSWN